MKHHDAVRAGLWLVALSAGVLGLWLLGHGPLAAPALLHPSRWATWAGSRDPVTGALAIVRLIVLGVALYLWLATLVNVVAAASPSAALHGLARFVTVPAWRRALGTAAGLGLSATVTLLPAAGALPRSSGPAASSGSVPAPAAAATRHTATMREVLAHPTATMHERTPLDQPPGGTATEHELPPDDGRPAGSATPSPTVSTGPPSSAVSPSPHGQASDGTPSGHDLRPEAPAASAGTSPSNEPATAAPSTAPPAKAQTTSADRPHPAQSAPVSDRTTEQAEAWTVAPGENFWAKAAEVLTRSLGRRPTDAEIVPYWRALIEANRAALADPANPDLIFPGQHFTVPPPG